MHLRVVKFKDIYKMLCRLCERWKIFVSTSLSEIKKIDKANKYLYFSHIFKDFKYN